MAARRRRPGFGRLADLEGDCSRAGGRRSTAAHEAPASLTLGLDLRSGPRYPTGLAVLDASRRLVHVAVVRTDEQIDAAIERFRPALVAIDAPLALPEGRCCADRSCACARYGIMREVDRICAAAGYRPFPALLPSMVNLTLRGIRLLGRLQAASIATVEVYPGMAQDVLGIPRKGAGVDGLRRGLKRAGIRGIPRTRRLTHDELDAVTCALVARLHLEAATETMGDGVPVPLVLPRREAACGTGEPSNGRPLSNPRTMPAMATHPPGTPGGAATLHAPGIRAHGTGGA